jgi:hypothetical protein
VIILDENLDVPQRRQLDSGAFIFGASAAKSDALECTITTRLSGSFTPFAVRPSSRAIKIFTVDG